MGYLTHQNKQALLESEINQLDVLYKMFSITNKKAKMKCICLFGYIHWRKHAVNYPLRTKKGNSNKQYDQCYEQKQHYLAMQGNTGVVLMSYLLYLLLHSRFLQKFMDSHCSFVCHSCDYLLESIRSVSVSSK